MKPILLLALASTVLSVNTVLPVRAIAELMPSDRHRTALLTQTQDPFAEAYQIGYRLGTDQGREFRMTNVSYSPNILGIGGEWEDETDWRAAIGYQAGFLAGFHDGYYPNASENPSEIERFNEGYNQGYNAGLNDALLSRYDGNNTYKPNPTSGRAEDAQYDNGYKLGYWQAFDKTWSDERRL
jgi:hypothetical protein